ncbi:MAG: HD domain-containing protein, partial [Microcella sp.]
IRYHRDVRGFIPAAAEVPGYLTMPDAHAAIWERAKAHLAVRNNDSHTLYAYGIARALVERVDGANPDVVLPAILLHDTGWSTVPETEILDAIAPGSGRPDLVRQHEVEGARIATEILTALGHDEAVVEEVVAIIDGHDSRREAISTNDACVKDADKLWRVTPHGLGIVQQWFGLDHDEALRICSARVQPFLLTEPGRAMGLALAAVASIDQLPQRAGLV